MYESHFGLHRQPFQCAELTRAFFLSQSIRTIVPQLLHALRSDLGVAVLTGPVGVGKTALLRHLQSTLSSEGRTILCSGASLESPLNVLQTLHTALNVRAAQQASIEAAGREIRQSRWTLLDQLQRTSELWGPVLLLIDDAQLLPVPVLNELRAFSEEEWNGRSLVRCLIAGPLSLEEELARPTHADFSHRIRCHAFLQPLTTRESLELLGRHLEAVGGKLHRVFTSTALELIASACDGLPRCLSLLADESLVIAAERSRTIADDECVRAALGRLQHLPYPWSASPLTSDEQAFDVESDESSMPHFAGTLEVAEPVVMKSTPGVIEFGGGPELPKSSGMIEVGSVPDARRQMAAVTIGESSPESRFEVGSRFTQDSSEAIETDLEFSSEFQELLADTSLDEAEEQFAGMELNSGYAISWTNLEDQFAVTEFQNVAAPQPSSVPAMSSVQTTGVSQSVVFSGEVEGSSSPASASPAFELSSRMDDRWLSASTGSGFSQRLPVFDRYTWVALGREVPSGAYSVRSSSLNSRVAFEDSLLQSAHRQPSSGRSFDHIHIHEVSVSEIDRRLAVPTGGGFVGDFVVHGTTELSPSASWNVAQVPSDTMITTPVVGVEFYNPPELPAAIETVESVVSFEPVRSDENRRAIREAILSRLSQVDGLKNTQDIENLVDSAISSFAVERTPALNESHWMDGQLVFGPRAQPQLVEDANSESVTADDSVPLESDDVANDASQTPERGTFFTLPSDVNAITWDLRSEVIENDDFLPIAQSLSALQSEVTTFHQNFRRDDANRWGESRDQSTPSDDTDSLIVQARRRLEDLVTTSANDSSELPLPKSAPSEPADRRSMAAAEESVISAQPDVKPRAAFGQLFTRLRQMKRASGEN